MLKLRKSRKSEKVGTKKDGNKKKTKSEKVGSKKPDQNSKNFIK